MERAFERLEFPGWPFDSLKKMLYSVSTSSELPRTLVVIDALDESQQGYTRKETTELLLQMGTEGAGKLGMIIFSRREPQFLESFRDCFHIIMQDHNREDISRLIEAGVNAIRRCWLDHNLQSNLQQDGRIEPELNARSDTRFPPDAGSQTEAEMERLRTYFLQHADGVVLWVRLVLIQLRLQVQSSAGFSIRALRETALTLPTELNEFYAHSIKASGVLDSPEKARVARRIFGWTIGSRAFQPLQLQDLLDALAIPETDESSLSHTEDPISLGRLQIGQDWNRFHDIVYQHCGALVEIVDDQNKTNENDLHWRVATVQPTWTVHLLHQTVKTFIETESESGELSTSEGRARRFVLDQSYKYLAIVLPKRMVPYTPKPLLSKLHRRIFTDSSEDLQTRLHALTKIDCPLGTEPLSQALFAPDEVACLSRWISGHHSHDQSVKGDLTDWLGYLSNRPLLRYAFLVIGDDAGCEKWIKDTTLLEHDGFSINASFALWWACTPYSPRDSTDDHDYLRDFAEMACQNGQIVPAEIVNRFVYLFDMTCSRTLQDPGAFFLGHLSLSLARGAVQALTASAARHSTCIYPMRLRGLAEPYLKFIVTLKRAVSDVDPSLLKLRALLNRNPEHHYPPFPRDSPAEGPVDDLEVSLYNWHCKLEEDIVGEKTVRVGNLIDVVGFFLRW